MKAMMRYPFRPKVLKTDSFGPGRFWIRSAYFRTMPVNMKKKAAKTSTDSGIIHTNLSWGAER